MINNGNWYFERRIENPTTIEAHLVDYMNGFEYTVIWGGVVRFEFSFDAREKKYIGLDGKFHHYRKDTHGIANWDTDEITIHNNKYLSHEILLHSGATIILLFTDLDYKRGTKASI